MVRLTSFLFTALLLLFSANAQQTATNFSSVDCQGNTHELFAQLNEGKVIVICWVMPCGPCIAPSLTTYKVVESFQVTHPDRVLFYMADDYGNTSCGALNAWANTYNMPSSSFSFRFSNPFIRMLDYGSDGMPKIVVIGGASREVHYNINDEVDANDLQNAINKALIAANVNEHESTNPKVKLSQNMNGKNINLSMHLEKFCRVNVRIMDMTGKNMINIDGTGETVYTLDINTSGLKRGIYILKVIRDEKEVLIRKIMLY